MRLYKLMYGIPTTNLDTSVRHPWFWFCICIFVSSLTCFYYAGNNGLKKLCCFLPSSMVPSIPFALTANEKNYVMRWEMHFPNIFNFKDTYFLSKICFTCTRSLLVPPCHAELSSAHHSICACGGCSCCTNPTELRFSLQKGFVHCDSIIKRTSFDRLWVVEWESIRVNSYALWHQFAGHILQGSGLQLQQASPLLICHMTWLLLICGTPAETAMRNVLRWKDIPESWLVVFPRRNSVWMDNCGSAKQNSQWKRNSEQVIVVSFDLSLSLKFQETKYCRIRDLLLNSFKRTKHKSSSIHVTGKIVNSSILIMIFMVL